MVFTPIQKSQWKQVKKIYFEAFPKAERKPFFLIKSSSKPEIFTASDNNQVFGFAVAFPYKDLVLVDYLAVNAALRSKGTGSFLLHEICNYYQDKKILLLIERLDEQAENKEQRIARKKFYLKNVFSSTGLFVNDISGNMEILSYQKPILKEEYLSIQKYTLGSLLFKLSKMKVVDNE